MNGPNRARPAGDRPPPDGSASTPAPAPAHMGAGEAGNIIVTPVPRAARPPIST
ncbi:hypothetical protein [Nonomuraea sp. NPDC050643]|uniref:hypothetical protein n=1 Tax=Nonomuraea sp. NPDC050643 TaxID=3155660 RepID=UPI0033CDF877